MMSSEGKSAIVYAGEGMAELETYAPTWFLELECELSDVAWNFSLTWNTQTGKKDQTIPQKDCAQGWTRTSVSVAHLAHINAPAGHVVPTGSARVCRNSICIWTVSLPLDYLGGFDGS